MREEFVYYIWENRLTDKDLKTAEGEAVEVVATGYRNTDSGPDFLEAKIQIGDKLWAGHVEIHVKSSDWNRHGYKVRICTFCNLCIEKRIIQITE